MRHVRVLYVEDNLTLRRLVVECITALVRQLLPEIELIWDLVSTLDEARSKLAVATPDVVLLDLELPGSGKQGGLRLLAWIPPATPVIVISAHLDSAAACEAQLHRRLYVVPKGGELDIDGVVTLLMACMQSPYDHVAPILAATSEPLDDKLDKTGEAITRHTLARCGGNKSAAARDLGVHRRTLQRGKK